MKEKKKKLFSVLSIVLLIILVLGATYAYFASQSGGSASVDITLTADTVDTLVFTTGDAITLNATQGNFTSGDGSLSSSTTASATLTANETSNSASGSYYVYLQINRNDFVYTTDDDTAEIILTITDPNGDVVESLSNLNYTTVTDNQGVSYSGFDITTWGGLIPIAESYAITATDESVTQDWIVTVTFVNLSTDQSANAGATIDIDLIIQDSEIVLTTLADYIISQYSEDGVNNLYYFDGSGSYTNADLEADDLSYRFVGGDYTLTDKAIEAGYSTITNTRTTSNDDITTTGFVNFYCNDNLRYVGYSCNSELSYYYTLAYDDSQTKYTTYEGVLGQAISDGYLEETYINNFTCFGSYAGACDEDDLYRIIGVFQNTDTGEYEVKLIKYSYASSSLLGTDGDYWGEYYGDNVDDFFSSSRLSSASFVQSRYYWNYTNYNASYSATGYYNDWSYSQLNTVNLNTYYYNNLDSIWQNMITVHTWIVGGNTSTNMYSGTAYSSYHAELVNYSTQVTTIYDSKLGLIYVSDYYYSADPTYWSYAGYNSDYTKSYAAAKDNNWMYMGLSEWTISRTSDTSHAYSLAGNGFVGSNSDSVAVIYHAVRPTFYLSSSTQLLNGDGSYSNPYRLNLAS